jgi:hypothetical protein
MAEQDRAPNLTGVYSDNPFAANQRGISGLERNYANQRAASNLAGGRIPGGPAGINDSGGAYWRQVQNDELSGTRLNRLLDRGGAYIQGARSRVGRAAAARGSFNTNQAIAEGEAAAIERAGEFAMQEAEAFGRAAGQNQDAFNQYRIAQERNLTDIQTADIGAGATIASAQIRVSGDLIQQDRDQRWRDRDREDQQEMDRERRGWDVEDRDMDYAFRDREREDQQQHDFDTLAEADRMNTGRQILDFVLSNPDLLNDPAAIEGFSNVVYDLFPSLRPRTTPGAAGRPANATSTPMGNSSRPPTNPNPTRPSAPDPNGVTAGPAPSPAQPPDTRPGGMTSPRINTRGRGGGGAGPTSYRTMRNMMDAARNNRVQPGRI